MDTDAGKLLQAKSPLQANLPLQANPSLPPLSPLVAVPVFEQLSPGQEQHILRPKVVQVQKS